MGSTLMQKRNNGLLAYKKNVHTQNGEDGIIEAIFQSIGVEHKTCCEFGAWDGIHLSNCRKLILDDWTAVMIEGDEKKYRDLCSNYEGNNKVVCVNAYVDDDSNSLDSILQKSSVPELDFLSIDIDGLDYDVFKTLDCRPRVICVEVNAGHSPDFDTLIPSDIAKDNIGQSLKKFCDAAKQMGYGLVCYNGNAFFIRNDCLNGSKFETISPVATYIEFLDHLEEDERMWLFWVNLALVPPYHKYTNPYLSRLKSNWKPALKARLR